MPEPYLIRLANRLGAGLDFLEPDRRARHREFILSFQTEDGGFRGREGDSDLYYTSFAIRSLAMLGGLTAADCERIEAYVRLHLERRLNVIDLVSWLYTAFVVQVSGGGDIFGSRAEEWSRAVAETLEETRTSDGGYAKTTEGAAGSTYHSFLVALVYELIGQPIPQPNRLVQFLFDRQRDDGGFVEIDPMRRSGTNPTAAAVALLGMLESVDSEIRSDVAAFLKDVRGDEGGFRANTRIPIADGLSTFTGLLTAFDLELPPVLPHDRVEAFITGELEFPTGGFRAASWDAEADVEYTFYGLGVLALLHTEPRGE